MSDNLLNKLSYMSNKVKNEPLWKKKVAEFIIFVKI